MRQFFPLLFLSVSIAFPAQADDCMEAIEMGDLTGVQIFCPELAERGNPEAQARLGHLHFTGLLGYREVEEGLKWLRLAAQQDHPMAQSILGMAYIEGDGAERNIMEGLALLKSAADKNYVPAMKDLGQVYGTGRYLRPDLAEALKWFEMGARADDPVLQHETAVYYSRGWGTPRNDVTALMWATLSADAGYWLGAAFRQELLRSVEPEDVLDAERMACRFLGQQDNCRETLKKAICRDVYKQEATRKDVPDEGKTFPRSLVVCGEAAERGDAEATFFIGLMHHNGHGFPLDYAKAAKWHRLAAQRGYASGALFLGDYYENGFGVPQDYVEAVKWYRTAAEAGSAGGMSSLGRMYEEGLGVQRNDVMAFMLYDMAYVLAAEKKGFSIIFAQYRERVAKRMSPDEISEARQLTRECEERNYKGCGF